MNHRVNDWVEYWLDGRLEAGWIMGINMLTNTVLVTFHKTTNVKTVMFGHIVE